MKILTAMYTLKRGGSYDRFKMLLEAFLERQCEVHCLSLTPIQIEHSLFYNHVMYFPFKTADGFIAKLLVLSIFPLWSVWVGWRNRIDLIIAFGSLYAFIQGISKWILKRPMVTLIRGSLTFGSKMQESPICFLYLNRIVESIGLHFSDRIITNNEAARVEILKRLGERLNAVEFLREQIYLIQGHKSIPRFIYELKIVERPTKRSGDVLHLKKVKEIRGKRPNGT